MVGIDLMLQRILKHLVSKFQYSINCFLARGNNLEEEVELHTVHNDDHEQGHCKCFVHMYTYVQ